MALAAVFLLFWGRRNWRVEYSDGHIQSARAFSNFCSRTLPCRKHAQARLAVQGFLGTTQKRPAEPHVILQKLSVPSGFSKAQRAGRPSSATRSLTQV